jgi:hypothetical protein
MRKNLSVLAGFALLLLSGCRTADQKVPEIAANFCNCFSEMEKNMGSKSREVMQKAANAADPTTAIRDEMQKLSEEDQQTVSTEMAAFAEMDDKNSKVGRCIADVEKKYGKEKTFDQKKFLQKIINELESKTGCTVTATLMKIGLKAKENGKTN